MGRGKVIGQDDKVVSVRNGDQLVRVSKCRIVKFGPEFRAKYQNCIKMGLSCDHDRINDDKRYHSESNNMTALFKVIQTITDCQILREVRMLKEIITSLVRL